MQISKTINKILDKLNETQRDAVFNLLPFAISGHVMHSSLCLHEMHLSELKLFLKMYSSRKSTIEYFRTKDLCYT